MKIKNFVLIILFAGIVLTFSGCNNKSGSKYDRSLFDRINVLVNIRMPREFSIIEGMMTQGIG